MSSRGVKQFHADLQLFARTLDINIGVVTQVVTTKIWNAVTLRTPVDTGRARAGWGISIGTPAAAAPPPGQYGPKGQSAVPVPSLEAVDGTQAVYILNNVDYIQYLEAGSSKQAPAGMVLLTLAEMELELEAELRSRGIGV